jgi:ABC-2 type transport system ATP-binding protein
MLIADNLWKSYKREPVLRGVSFTVQPSNVLGVCGSNGAGKTTLISLVASILPPDQGSLSLMGIPLGQIREYRQLIGYVPQNIALSPRLSVRQNLAFWAAIKGYHGQALQAVVEEAAAQANVSGFLNKQVGRCSGGMARRANLAAGLIGQPRLILLDEPTAGIDEDNRNLILGTIEGLKKKGCIILMVNHYYNELAEVCDRIITLKNGVIAEEGAYDF